MGTREYACSVTLMTILDPGEDNKDNATAWDLRQAIDSLTSACSQGQGDGWCTGGYQIYGENNRLAAFAYHPDSEFSDAIDISRGCVRRRWVKVYDMMVRLRVFHRYCDDTGEDDSKGWGAESGPSGTKEIQQYCSNGKLSLADVLYGLDRAKQWVVENCQGAIVGVGSVG
ncbi:MAG: hypothetical protein M1812_004742 [Candelaria pacifica]|nr:MAG: hypothetical protein M1812_004742 [Candelaria pacifica]